MRDSGLGITLQQILTIRCYWRITSIGDGNPHSGYDDDPHHGWPASVRQDVDELFADRPFENATVGGEDDGGDDKVDVREVKPGEVIEEDDAEAAVDRGTEFWVSFVEVGFEGA